MTTYTSGLPFPSIRRELTTDALNSPLFKNGSLAWTTHSFASFSSQERAFLKKPALNTNAQFGLATLWRRAKHKFTPQLVKDILASDRFQNRLELWTIIHALGSNTKARFEQTKMLRSHEGGLTLRYTLRRLANNVQEPFRTLSLQAIDTSIKWWQGKPAPRASALRSPWSLTPNLQRQLKKFLRKWHLQVLSYQVPCHNPPFKMVFIKHAAVLDQLCNHKQAITAWSSGKRASCCCKHWLEFKTAALNPSDPHWVLAGSLLHSLLPEPSAAWNRASLSCCFFHLLWLSLLLFYLLLLASHHFSWRQFGSNPDPISLAFQINFQWNNTPWKTPTAVKSTTIWLGLLCIWITSLVSFLSLNHQWTGTIILRISMDVSIGHLPKLGTFIPSCPSHRPHQFPLWSLMEACRHIWFWTQSPIYDPFPFIERATHYQTTTQPTTHHRPDILHGPAHVHLPQKPSPIPLLVTLMAILHNQSQNRPLRGTLVQRKNNDQLSLQLSLQMNPQHLHLLCRSFMIFR